MHMFSSWRIYAFPLRLLRAAIFLKARLNKKTQQQQLTTCDAATFNQVLFIFNFPFATHQHRVSPLRVLESAQSANNSCRIIPIHHFICVLWQRSLGAVEERRGVPSGRVLHTMQPKKEKTTCFFCISYKHDQRADTLYIGS